MATTLSGSAERPAGQGGRGKGGMVGSASCELVCRDVELLENLVRSDGNRCRGSWEVSVCSLCCRRGRGWAGETRTREQPRKERAAGLAGTKTVEFKWLEAARHPSQARMTRDVRRDNNLG
jgi:hypothetical protein